MNEIITNLIVSLNLVEVHGDRNLALLYNAIDTLKQFQKSIQEDKKAEGVVETVDENGVKRRVETTVV